MLQLHRFEEVQQPAMQHGLCGLEFYLVAEDTWVQGLLLRLRMPPEGGLQKRLWAVLLTFLLAILLLNCNTLINKWSLTVSLYWLQRKSIWFLLHCFTILCICKFTLHVKLRGHMLVMEVLNHRKACSSLGSELFSHNLLCLSPS